MRGFLSCRALAVAFLISIAVPGGMSAAQRPDAKPKTKDGAASTELVWPNAESLANSDDWLVRNHDKIRQMRPKVLVINYVNGLAPAAGEAKVRELIGSIRESSRYHGYKNPGKGQGFLEYEVFKYVDLKDPAPLPESRKLDGNSSRYPRLPNSKDGINFNYGKLFTSDFAKLCAVPDPKKQGRMLNLAEMVNTGLIHEVWFLAIQGNFGAPFECTEVKQVYDENFRKIRRESVQAGNGGSPSQPFVGRSLRILFINAERGPGCAMESLAHAMEGTARSNAVPYFSRYFKEYAGFDLDARYKLPFDSLYARTGGADLSYPAPDTLAYTVDGRRETVKPYLPIGGNAHFPPNGRKDYDLDNPDPVLSTIEHYRLRDGEGGKDKAESWTVARFAAYRQSCPDCMGPWLVYWRQNMPGFESKAKADNGKPMKNWWPFRFY